MAQLEGLLSGMQSAGVPAKEIQAFQKESAERAKAMEGCHAWCVDWFLENLPLENKYGTSFFPLMNRLDMNRLDPTPYEDNPDAPKVEPMSVIVFADSYGFATGILKHAPEGRISRKSIQTTPPHQWTQEKIKQVLADKFDLMIYAYGIDEPKDDDVDTFLQKQEDVTKFLFNISKEIANNGSLVSKIAVVTCDTFAEETEIHQEMGIGLVTNCTLFGFLNTLRQELDIPCHFVDTEWSLPETMMPVLAAEVWRDVTFGCATTRILKSGRWVQKWMNVKPEYTAAKHKITLRDGGVIGVSGGNGGVALICGTWLVRLAKEQGIKDLSIEFLSRSMKVADESIPQWTDCQRIAEECGVKVVQAKMDVSDPAAVKEYVEKYAKDLIGFVHSAGVLRDGMLFGLTWEMFDQVWNPKNRAATHLHYAFEKYEPPLDFFWMFSSTSVYGNMGQLNYSAANSAMDGIARRRKALGKPVLAIQWGAWGEVGMAANLDDASKRRMANSPMPPFSNKQGIDGLENLIATGVAYGSVLQMQADFVTAMVTNQGDPYHASHWNRNLYEGIVTPYPSWNRSPANAYCLYKSLIGHPRNPKDGLVWKYYVKPVVDPNGEQDEETTETTGWRQPGQWIQQ